MSPNEISVSFDKISIFSSSESSDSESLLQEDVKSNEHQINKQWEAIERTLYQEQGEQVTDPELLKECELWRETFPHFRVKGTKINLNQSNDKIDDTDKSIQTFKNHFDLKKLEKKRESIKKKVVGELVERLIAKYGFEKEENSEVKKNYSSSVQITEISENDVEKLSNSSSKNNNFKKNSVSSSVVSIDKESYFERGKKVNRGFFCQDGMSVEQVEKNLHEIFDSWEKDCKTAQLSQGCDYKNVGNSMKQSFTQSSNRSAAMWYKPKKLIPPSNSLSNIEKPYEVTKKIDKKYDGLIERIMERRFNDFDSARHCRITATRLERKSYQESLEKLRKESGFDDYLKRNNMPKLNNFNNNWLKRNGQNSHTEDIFLSKKTQNVKPKVKKNFNLHSEKEQIKVEDTFLEDLKSELTLTYKKPPKKNEIIEEISLQRPKPFAHAVEKSFKSSSCGDLPKKNKKETKSRQLKSGIEVGKSESNLKNRVRSNKLSLSKPNGNQNSLLPPIESGIICKEIKKMGSKTITKRY